MKNIFPLLTISLSFLSLLIVNKSLAMEEFYPENLIQLDPIFNHHVIIAEKSTHQMHLFEYEEGYPRLVKSYDMATGKVKGDKQFSGDHKTPEGIYTIRNFIPRDKLLKRYGKEGEIYGVGAFTLDYPNSIDLMNKKTGGGIWLHSTNDESRISKGLDSRGCVVVANNHLKEVSSYLEMNKTTFIIVDKISYLKKELWLKERLSIKTQLKTWLESWKKEDLNKYISHYSKSNFYSRFKGGYKKYKKYKKSVFWQKGSPDIQISQMSIFKHKDYLRIRFIQDYRSSRIKDTGLKTLYMKKNNNYEWKIVREIWNKHNFSFDKLKYRANSTFRPSMRFFTKNETTGNYNE